MEEKTKLNMQMYDAESILAPLQKLNLMDDFLFDAATGDLETCRIIIELSLGIRIRNIAWKEGQKVIRNLPVHSPHCSFPRNAKNRSAPCPLHLHFPPSYSG